MLDSHKQNTTTSIRLHAIFICQHYKATSSILLSARDFSLELPMNPQPWWEILVGTNMSQEIVTAANSIRGLCTRNRTDVNPSDGKVQVDALVASKGYVVSCRRNGEASFTDPGGFLWEQLEDSFLSSIPE